MLEMRTTGVVTREKVRDGGRAASRSLGKAADKQCERTGCGRTDQPLQVNGRAVENVTHACAGSLG